MKRIILIVIRTIFKIPFWLRTIVKYENTEKYSREERYGWLRDVIATNVIIKGRVNLECFGLENLPKEDGYLLTPNHQGLFDAVAVVYHHKRPFRAVVKKELESTFVVKDVVKMVEFRGMDRNDIRTSVRLIKACAKDMKENHTNYLIFPEGTRSRNKNELLEFKGGSFKVAMDAKAPIVPVALIDCYKVFDNNTIAPVNAQIHFLPPIYYEEYQGLKSNDVAVIVQKRIEDCIKKNKTSD